MKSEWRVCEFDMGPAEPMYGLYRLRDAAEVVVEKNIEYNEDDIMYIPEDAQKWADELNKEIGRR